jgi:hypothetical protein
MILAAKQRATLRSSDQDFPILVLPAEKRLENKLAIPIFRGPAAPGEGDVFCREVNPSARQWIS